MNLRTVSYALLAASAFLGAYLLLDHLVVTDLERIEDLVGRGAHAASARSVEACLALAVPDCAVDPTRGESLRAACEALFRDCRELKVTIDRVEAEIRPAGDRAVARVKATVTPTFAESGISGALVALLDATFVKTGETWLVERIGKTEWKSLLEEKTGR